MDFYTNTLLIYLIHKINNFRCYEFCPASTLYDFILADCSGNFLSYRDANCPPILKSLHIWDSNRINCTPCTHLCGLFPSSLIKATASCHWEVTTTRGCSKTWAERSQRYFQSKQDNVQANSSLSNAVCICHHLLDIWRAILTTLN